MQIRQPIHSEHAKTLDTAGGFVLGRGQRLAFADLAAEGGAANGDVAVSLRVRRLRGRGSDSDDVIDRRIAGALPGVLGRCAARRGAGWRGSAGRRGDRDR